MNSNQPGGAFCHQFLDGPTCQRTIYHHAQAKEFTHRSRITTNKLNEKQAGKQVPP